MKWVALAFLLFISNFALAQNAQQSSPQSPQQSPQQSPMMPTSIEVKSLITQKPSVGDVVMMKVTPPEEFRDAEPSVIENLQKGAASWGKGKILWWKPYDAETNSVTLGLTTYAPGKFEIPSLSFKKGENFVYSTQPQEVEFQPIGGDKSKDDIYPPSAIAFPTWVYVVLSFIGLILFLVLIYFAVRWFRKYQKRKLEYASAPRILNPLEEFEETAVTVENKNHLQKAEYKRHYFALSDASKKFLGKSFHFDAEEKTSRELAYEFERVGLDLKCSNRWKELFAEMDIIKFTDQIPANNEAQSLSTRLSELVRESYFKSPAHEKSLRDARDSQRNTPKSQRSGKL